MKIIIEQLKRILSFIDNGGDSERVKDDVKSAIDEVNIHLFGVKKISIQNQCERLSEEIRSVIEVWEKCLSHKADIQNSDIWYFYDLYKYVDSEDISYMLINRFNQLPEALKEEYRSLKIRYTFLHNGIDYRANDYSLIYEYVEMLKSNFEDLIWFYQKLEDHRSKKIFLGILKFWHDFDFYKLRNYSETIFRDYYDLDILKCDKEEVVVDCGAYIGDSICDYIRTYADYKKIYAYEITPKVCKMLRENLKDLPNIEIRECGVSDSNKTMYIASEDGNMGNSISESGSIATKVVAIDSDIKEKITLLKMDIEGEETSAIHGCQNHIVVEKPKLLICTYHRIPDIFEIPKLIYSFRSDYKFYFRYTGKGIWPCDYYLIAI